MLYTYSNFYFLEVNNNYGGNNGRSNSHFGITIAVSILIGMVIGMLIEQHSVWRHLRKKGQVTIGNWEYSARQV